MDHLFELTKSFGLTKGIEVNTALGQVSLAERAWAEPIDLVFEPKHYWLELQLLPTVADGQARFADKWSGNQYESIGRVYLLPMSEAVHLKSSCREYFGVSCSFMPEAIDRWFDNGLDWTENRLRQCVNITSPVIQSLLFRLSEEIRMPGLGSEVLTELYFEQIMIQLARYCLGSEERADKGGLAAWRMRLIKERLAEPGARVSLNDLATLCNMSPRQLTRAFRTSNGCSIGDYVAQSRIVLAKRLLKTNQNVKSIVHALGFNSPSHFYAAFRRSTGETPLKYRQRLGLIDQSLTLETERDH
jgi:AraC family transcriptional regulator